MHCFRDLENSRQLQGTHTQASQIAVIWWYQQQQSFFVWLTFFAFRIDTNLLVAKKKDFMKMMNEIPEMYSELKQMAVQKEKWRDEKYSDMYYTRA